MWKCPHCGDEVPDTLAACGTCHYTWVGRAPAKDALAWAKASGVAKDAASVAGLCSAAEVIARICTAFAATSALVLFWALAAQDLHMVLPAAIGVFSAYVSYVGWMLAGRAGRLLLALREDVRDLRREIGRRSEA